VTPVPAEKSGVEKPPVEKPVPEKPAPVVVETPRRVEPPAPRAPQPPPAVRAPQLERPTAEGRGPSGADSDGGDGSAAIDWLLKGR
jgi:hypothetical protein